MSIQKMKRIRLIGLRSEKEALLDELLRFGKVEVSDYPQAEGDVVVFSTNNYDKTAIPADMLAVNQQKLTAALDILQRYFPEKKKLLDPKPEAPLETFLSNARLNSCLHSATRVIRLDGEIKNWTAKIQELKETQTALQPWMDLDMPLDAEGTEHVCTTLCSLPADAQEADVLSALEYAAPESELIPVSSDKFLRYCVLICHRDEFAAAEDALRNFSYSPMEGLKMSGTAKLNADHIAHEIEFNEVKIERAKAKLMGETAYRAYLQQAWDGLATKLCQAESRSKMLNSESSFAMEGWIAEEDLPELERILGQFIVHAEFEDPEPEEYPDVPVKLKNNILTRCMNMITNMYALPTYDGVDPNPLMAPFFIIFYGMMMADMGYGILMFVGGMLMIRKMKARGGMRDFGELLIWCGISTFLWGAATGGFFGDFIPQALKIINPASTFTMPALFTPLEDTIAILFGSLALGVLQIFTGMVVSVKEKFKNKDFKGALFEEFTWWAILLGAVLAILGIGNAGRIPVLLCVGGLLLVTGCFVNNKGFAKVTSIVGAVYNGVTGYFSDILSYARLMALMLAGSVISQVFNTLGSVTGNILLFVIVSMIGNLLNLALNLLGCYVHDLRLQCLEFFKRFYKEGGKPFRPLDVQTKYYNVTERE
ncbi:MAG: V-type ATP synthase subunit I [Firmicutes bacterium]|nr:V-type ATP synthase subunit I [Bacillota bacterium]